MNKISTPPKTLLIGASLNIGIRDLFVICYLSFGACYFWFELRASPALNNSVRTIAKKDSRTPI